MGLKEDLLKSISEASYVPYEVNGTKCTLRVWNGIDRSVWETYITKEHDTDDARALFVSLSIGDENGNKVFTKADIAELGKRDYRVLDKIIEDASALNQTTQNEIRALEKN